MAYKRYFYRNGKRFGPYYYESYRDKNGKVKKKYLGVVNPDEEKSAGKVKKIVTPTHLFAFFILLIIAGFLFSSLELQAKQV